MANQPKNTKAHLVHREPPLMKSDQLSSVLGNLSFLAGPSQAAEAPGAAAAEPNAESIPEYSHQTRQFRRMRFLLQGQLLNSGAPAKLSGAFASTGALDAP